MLKFTTNIVNLCLIFILFGCTTAIETRGYFPEESKIANLTVGKTTKSGVVNNIGYPSSVTAFDNNTWLYIESKFETNAFFNPKEISSKVLEISFDDSEKVTQINNYSVDDAQKMTFSKDATPTYGHSVNAVQQMLGNIGKFNKPQ